MPRTGRPRAFDTDEALAKARDVFWSRGYAGTSVQNLVDELGVQRGSLYAAFGDKHDLYLRAVGLYARDNVDQLRTLLAVDPVLPTLRRMLIDPTTVTGGVGGRRGCLVGNTTAELVPGDEGAGALVAGSYADFLEVVAAALRRAQHTGEVSAAADPRAQAELLLVLFQGSALVARATDDRDAFAAGLELALAALRA